MALLLGGILLYFLFERPVQNKLVNKSADNSAGTVSSTITWIEYEQSVLQNVQDAHLKEDVYAVKSIVERQTEAAQKSLYLDSLSKIWARHNNLVLSAYYKAQVSKLENSSKSLNFAAQFLVGVLGWPELDPSLKPLIANEAVEVLTISETIEPLADSAKIALGVAYIEGLNEPMTGVQQLLAVVRDNPQNVEAIMMLGRMSIQSGQLDKALERFEAVLAIEPQNKEAYFFLADVYKQLGQVDKAKATLNTLRALVNNPEFDKDLDEYLKSF